MDSRSSSKWNTHIYQEACEWFVEFRAGEPGEGARKAFRAWLQQSPAHMGAYLEVSATWHDGASLNRNGKWDADELIEQARHEPDNVVSLNGPEARADSRTGRTPARSWFARAASIVLVVAAAAAGLYNQRGTYTTDIGEQRSIALDDGSTVQLDARSKLRVRFDDRQRNVELLRGQALFAVEKDAGRPFIVSSEGTRVRAVGTQFDVHRKATGTIVTVVEGTVAVLPPFPRNTRAAPGSGRGREGVRQKGVLQQEGEILLFTGEQLALTEAVQVPAPRPVNVGVATAWTQRQFVFESATLADVVEQFNRYNRNQLIIRDHGLDDFRIDGVFSSADPTSLIRFLRTLPGVQVAETDSEVIIGTAPIDAR